MKKIVIILNIIFSIILFGKEYKANDIELDIKVEEGIERIYINGEYANGVIVFTNEYPWTGNGEVEIARFNFNDGILDGNFILNNKYGDEFLRAKGKINDEIFEGKINYYNGDTIEGRVYIGRFEFFLKNIGVYVENIINEIIEGIAISGNTVYKYDNGYAIEKNSYYDNELKKIKTKEFYLKDEENLKYVEDYYKTGELFRKFKINEINEEVYLEEFHKNGIKMFEGIFDYRIYKKLHEDRLFYMSMSRIPFYEIYLFYKTQDREKEGGIKDAIFTCIGEDGNRLIRIIYLTYINPFSTRYADYIYYENESRHSWKEFDLFGNIFQKFEYYKDWKLERKEYKDGFGSVIIEIYDTNEKIKSKEVINIKDYYQNYFEKN